MTNRDYKRQYQTSNGRAPNKDYDNDGLSITLDSPMNRRIQRAQYEKVKLLAEDLNRKMFIEENHVVDPETGKLLINIEDANKWFSEHVYMLFSIGKVFDKDDRSFMDSVLNYFSKPNECYLACRYDVLSYKNSTVQEIENNIAVENGNYHILLVVIVYADKDELEESPEFMFNTSGIVKWTADPEMIKDIMLMFLNRYGIATEKVSPSKLPQQVSGRRDSNTLTDIKFHMNSDVDWNSGPNRMLFSDLDYRNERDQSFAIRTRVEDDARINKLREKPGKSRTIQNSLYSQMKEASLLVPTVPLYSQKRGVISKMEEDIIPSEYVPVENRLSSENGASPQRNFKIYDVDMVSSNKSGNDREFVRYSTIYNYGVDEKMDLKSTGTGRVPGRVIRH